MRVPVLVLLALAACNREGGGDDTNSDNPGEVPDVLQGAEETEECANFEVSGTPVGAATTYWAGDYTFSGQDVHGYEYWYWIPSDLLSCQSDDWDGEPCILIWEYFGTKDDEPENCPGCLYTLSGSGSFRASDSDCPPELEAIEGQDMPVLFYKVRDNSSGGGVTLYFESDNPVGNGTSAAGGLEWRSEGMCSPNGSSTPCD